MQHCAEHVVFQFPNEHTRAGYLVDGIQCPDTGLEAAMTSVKMDNVATRNVEQFQSSSSTSPTIQPCYKEKDHGHQMNSSTNLINQTSRSVCNSQEEYW